MKLLDAIKEINVCNLSRIESIRCALEERIDWLNDREPESCGSVYDAWSEKVDELQDILDNIEELIEETDVDKKKELIEEIQSDIDMYQLMHGGLSRLKI